ncbi:hypothetical protein GCM10022240_13400 [Microbacterium kribbense]|uniref:TadE family protein n=1 Tax=Microbacterium kribbense TaxID=433645 RepID=A0ABP7GCK6_9MICO
MLLRRASADVGVRAPDDAGNAPLEFILLGVVLLVPIVYLIISLGLIQGQSLGVAAGARHIARAVATAPDADAARARADAALASIVDEYEMDAGSLTLDLSCRPAGRECPRVGATLVVTLRARVGLPLVPPVLGLDELASIPVEASSAQRVSRLRGAQ